MGKAILMASVTALSLGVIGTSSHAEVITCSGGGATLRIDTKSRAVLLIDDEKKQWTGRALAIDNEKIVYGLNGTDETWSLDRKTGETVSLRDGDKDRVQCQRVK